MNEWLGTYEPIWLFTVLAVEMIVGIVTAVFVIKEFYYDERKDREKSHKMRRTRKSVKVVVEDGQARVVEAPKDIDVTVEQKGE